MRKSNTVILENRAFLSVRGPDAETFLQGIVSQDVSALTHGEAAFTCLLTPQGKILFDFFVIRDESDFVIDCFAESAEALLKRLSLYKLRADVALTPLEDWAAAIVLREAIDHTADTVYAFTDPRLSALGQRLVGDQASIEETLSKEATLAPQNAYETHRIELGVSEFGVEFVSEELFPMDINYDALNGVNYKKGCFVGQEVASRMKRKGDVRKRTLIAAYEGDPPAKGDTITAGESKLGEILSTESGKALALIRLDRWEKAKAAGDKPVIHDQHVHLTVPEYLNQD